MSRISFLFILCTLPAAVLPLTAWSYEFAGYPERGKHRSYSETVAGGYYPDSLRLEKGRTESGYYLRAYLKGLRPENIQVYPRRNRLVLEVTADNRRGASSFDARRVSQWQARYRRQLRLPYDADPTGMTRTVKDGIVEIHIPRRRQTLPAEPNLQW